MEGLLKYELGFFTALMSLMVAMWQGTSRREMMFYFKLSSILVGLGGFMMAFLWIDYIDLHPQILTKNIHKTLHYMVLLSMEVPIAVLGFLFFINADRVKLKK
ncbi:MAG: hypothetical protein QME81_09690 [bacterium]|nr:hypothetical protein [bacterium]